MEVNFNPETQAKLNRVAAETGSASEYVRQLVEHYLDHDQWFRQKVKNGIQQLDSGQFLTQDEMRVQLEEMLRT